ncbi:MAG TPA: HEAT repeat domain-containing protein [Aggregatilineales bacterium]|nr:HEAT repeat domain-containing protein [Aggregatilineales bacterium]
MPNLVEFHLLRLQDKSVEVRLRSINELRLLGDPVALPELERLYRSDPDPEVRKAAQAAGRELFQKKKSQA